VREGDLGGVAASHNLVCDEGVELPLGQHIVRDAAAAILPGDGLVDA